MNAMEIDKAIEQITASKKYRTMEIPSETIRDLLEQENVRFDKQADVIKSVKSKLHNIMAPYLGDLNYPEAAKELGEALSSGDKTELTDVCIRFLKVHDSTAERLAYAQDFFGYIFGVLGKAPAVLDLACGLNPFMLPLVDLPDPLTYTAYDIHAPRIQLIGQLFDGIPGIEGSAETRDILVRPPQQKANAAFLFKEAHRMEKRRSGATRELIRSLRTEHIFISLPNHSLNGAFDLRERMQRLVEGSIEGLGLELETQAFPSETIYHLENRDVEA